jgi:Ion channel
MFFKLTVMNQIYKAFQNFWTHDKSFTFLLIVLALYVFGIIPLLTDDVFSKIAFLFFYYLLLTSSMPFLLKRNQKLIALGLVLFPFIFLLVEIFFITLWLQVLTDIFIVLYCVFLGAIILIRTFEKGRIDNRRVQGAIIVYLLTGLVFCLIYHSIFILNATKSFSGLVGSHRKEFLYFSLCTLTTDGYGDILPLTPFARSLSNLEALVGQLYPAVLIARLVSMEFYYKQPQS